ncbi:MAG: cytochrome c peroxidase [Gammaproteobacteria bacterium]
MRQFPDSPNSYNVPSGDESQLGNCFLPMMMILALFTLSIVSNSAHARVESEALAEFGQILFFDLNLSRRRTQSCATCHDPATAFIDPRDNGVNRAVSLGDDGRALGDRNTPSTAYAVATPDFYRNEAGDYIGGFFLDGRAPSLGAQATEPLFNPLEMDLPNPATALSRILEDPGYVARLTKLYGEHVLSDETAIVEIIGASIAAFEQTAYFSSFDSKYDRHVRGEYVMTELEESGRRLFFSPLTNCTSCHLFGTSSVGERETFSNYQYHNIGLPPNEPVRVANQLGENYRDKGLFANPQVDDAKYSGKFKVPSLRNVAVTAPYMHNGIFQELRTAILFYNKFLIGSRQSQTNPETGHPWVSAEFPATIDIELLDQGQPINEGRATALIAFLKTLTDRRYEHLLDD